MVCGGCGHSYIGGSSCPNCGNLGKAQGDSEIMRKTFDEPDLKKGGW